MRTPVAQGFLLTELLENNSWRITLLIVIVIIPARLYTGTKLAFEPLVSVRVAALAA